MLAIIKVLVKKFVAGFISKVALFKDSSTDENKSTQSASVSKMNSFLVGLAIGGVLAGAIGYYLHCSVLLDIEYEVKETTAATQNVLLEKAHERAIELEETIAQVRTDYDRINSELVRLRIENASLRGGESAGASAECSSELAKREDLLLRMASLGIRTSEAVAEKQAALKNCVDNYAGLKAR